MKGMRDEEDIDDNMIGRYIPVLMGQAKIYWDHENYQQVEKMFRQSNEFCREHDVSPSFIFLYSILFILLMKLI